MRDVPSSPLPTPAVPIPREAIAELCRRNWIRKLSLFGSVLRTDFASDSDIDVLVEFQEGAPVGYVKFVEIQLALADLLGRRVDLHTPTADG